MSEDKRVEKILESIKKALCCVCYVDSNCECKYQYKKELKTYNDCEKCEFFEVKELFKTLSTSIKQVRKEAVEEYQNSMEITLNKQVALDILEDEDIVNIVDRNLGHMIEIKP
jgi:hypothetical protein